MPWIPFKIINEARRRKKLANAGLSTAQKSKPVKTKKIAIYASKNSDFPKLFNSIERELNEIAQIVAIGYEYTPIPEERDLFYHVKLEVSDIHNYLSKQKRKK